MAPQVPSEAARRRLAGYGAAGVGVGAVVGEGVGDGAGDAVGEAVGDADGVGEGCADALGDGDGDVPGLADGDGVTWGSGPTLKSGTILPIRGRSAWGPLNGAFWLGAAMTSASTAAVAATPTAASGATIARLRAGRSPVFCGERAYARRSGVRMMPSAARLAHGALE